MKFKIQCISTHIGPFQEWLKVYTTVLVYYYLIF